jgi:hypothetical protein
MPNKSLPSCRKLIVPITISKDKKKFSGTLFPACYLKMNKEGQVELELYQNPWKLVNIMKR